MDAKAPRKPGIMTVSQLEVVVSYGGCHPEVDATDTCQVYIIMLHAGEMPLCWLYAGMFKYTPLAPRLQQVAVTIGNINTDNNTFMNQFSAVASDFQRRWRNM